MQLNNSLISKLCFIICLGFVLPQTYSISGKIMECETETPIDNVDVYIENFEIGTVTDKDGYFILYLNDQELNSIDLNINMIGYQKMIMSVDLSSSIIDLGDIHIKVESLELESVHIHSHQHRLHQISDISLIGQELTDNLTGNIANTLSNQPNIGVN